MSETAMNKNDFVGYEYRDINVGSEMEAMYADGYENFGWILESSKRQQIGFNYASLKFKRDRKIRNKAELSRLQRQFDACVSEIISMEKSKTSSASVAAYTIGLVGTAFMAGAVFSYLAGLMAMCIILAAPAFIGWIIPYFVYSSARAKKSSIVAPVIEGKYDEAYEVCEKANSLL